MQHTTKNNGQLPPDSFSTGPSNHPRQSLRGLRTGAILLLALVILLVFGTGLFAGWQFGTSRGITQSATNTAVPVLQGENSEKVREAVIAKVRPAVVQVNIATQNGQGGLGSGVIIDKRGYIVTNNHVVDGARQIQVTLYDGKALSAQLVGTSPPDDLAVIKVNSPAQGLTVATLGNSSQMRVGQEVLAIGNPLGITQTVTNGIVSALERTVGSIPDAIQTDAPINPGNSGGALVDLQGKLIGIPTSVAIDPAFKAPASGVGFAVPANRVQFIASQIIETGKVTNSGRAALGISVISVNPDLAAQNSLSIDRGALIASITPGGAAEQAGLKTGDVIVQVGDQQVNDAPSLGDALVNKKPGDTVSVQIYRGSQQQTIQVKPGQLKTN